MSVILSVVRTLRQLRAELTKLDEDVQHFSREAHTLRSTVDELCDEVKDLREQVTGLRADAQSLQQTHWPLLESRVSRVENVVFRESA